MNIMKLAMLCFYFPFTNNGQVILYRVRIHTTDPDLITPCWRLRYFQGIELSATVSVVPRYTDYREEFKGNIAEGNL